MHGFSGTADGAVGGATDGAADGAAPQRNAQSWVSAKHEVSIVNNPLQQLSAVYVHSR